MIISLNKDVFELKKLIKEKQEENDPKKGF